MSFDGIKAVSSLRTLSAFQSFQATSAPRIYPNIHTLTSIIFTRMFSNMKFIVCTILLSVVFAVLVNDVDATYRKPPFNGSIFGKRGSTVEYDSASKALSAMCEIANEACQSWFPNQDNK